MRDRKAHPQDWESNVLSLSVRVCEIVFLFFFLSDRPLLRSRCETHCVKGGKRKGGQVWRCIRHQQQENTSWQHHTSASKGQRCTFVFVFFGYVASVGCCSEKCGFVPLVAFSIMNVQCSPQRRSMPSVTITLILLFENKGRGRRTSRSDARHSARTLTSDAHAIRRTFRLLRSAARVFFLLFCCFSV
jgi:hypothetical protein